MNWPVLIHVPHQGLLASVVILILLNEVLHKEKIVGQIVFLLHVDVKAMGNLVKVVLCNATDEAVVFQFILHTLHLITQSTKGINNETLDDGQQDDNDEEEESDVEQDTVDFVIIAVRVLDFITDTTTSSYTLEYNNMLIIL